jgi:hypothetical protein
LPFKFAAEMFSNAEPEGVAAELSDLIHTLHGSHDYQRIDLLAHSMGGLIARGAVIRAAVKHYTWFKCLKRLALLESTNRGYRPRRLRHKLLLIAVRAFNQGRLARSVLVGARFVVGLRLDWIRVFTAGIHTAPETIQLLAQSTRRPIVLEDDSQDLIRSGNAEQRYASGVNHFTIAEVTNSQDVHFQQIKDALRGLVQVQNVQNDPAVKLVVFIAHGIRDYGLDWMQKLDDAIKKLMPSAVVVQNTYRYFSILNFLRRSDRQQKITDLVDAYVDHLIRYPKADFACAGHSNGTYVLGQALLDFSSLKFQRVFLAGSVLPQEFDWQKIGNNQQVSAVRNDMANRDWPVGFLCAAIQFSPLHKDLGVGGFLGFTKRSAAIQDSYTAWVPGGHGAAIEPVRLDSIAKFLVEGSPGHADSPVSAVDSWLGFFSKYAGFSGLLLLVISIVAAIALVFFLPLPWNLVALVIYLTLIYLLVARF